MRIVFAEYECTGAPIRQRQKSPVQSTVVNVFHVCVSVKVTLYKNMLRTDIVKLNCDAILKLRNRTLFLVDHPLVGSFQQRLAI